MKAVIAIVSVLFLPCILMAQSSSQGVLARDLERALANLSELERNLSPMHRGLIEPLEFVADQLILEGRYEQAHRALDRAIQIVRVSEGLFTTSQFPYQEKKVLNIVNSGNWDDARVQLEHLFWLYTKKSKYATSELMASLITMSEIHLRGVSEDAPEHQAFHLRRGSRTNWLALAVGEAVWGVENPLLVPIIYKTVTHLYLEKVATDRQGLTSRNLREVAVGTAVRTRAIEYMDMLYYQLGSRLLNQIKGIYSAQEPANPEAVAMAQLYIADWDALFRRNENVLLTYKTVFDGLSEAVQDESAINAFFDRPKLLPEPQFYPSLQLALSSSISRLTYNSLGEMDVSDKIVFSEWSSNFPFVQQPITLPRRENSDYGFAIFSFSIGGAPEIAQLLRRSKRAKIGVAENLKVVEPAEAANLEASKLSPKVKFLRFRPKLVDGVPQMADATLVYIPAVAY
ncbi:MAG: hypothetical protein ACI8V0_002559 [Pseudohongiellaceae bacterium]|jgi:hypothetical protein